MRLLLITSVFPNPQQPTRGIFNLQMAQALAEHHELKVIAPVSWVEELRTGQGSEWLKTGRSQMLAGIEVHYPRFYYTPKIFRYAYSFFLWHSLKKVIQRILGTFSPDAVMAYWAHPDGAVAVRLAKLIGVPSILVIGGSDVLLLTKDRLRRAKIQKALNGASAVVALSDDLRNKIVQLGIDGRKVQVWHRGVDETVFFPGDREESRRRLGLPETGHKLLWVGRMVPVKGLDILVQACAKIRERGRDFHVYLAGDGPMRRRIESEVAARGLTGSITFVGPVLHEQLGDWYRAADATVMSSHSEGIPNVLRESLACGTPFVATRVGGIPELANGSFNKLVPPGDPTALAQAIEDLLVQVNGSRKTQWVLPNWNEAARSFTNIVHPLVSASQNPDHPWWITEGVPMGAPKKKKSSPKPGRRLARNTIARFLPLRLIIRGPAATRSVYLTFDDGPHPKHTPELLKVLQDHDIKATFFVIGRLVEKYPQLVSRIREEGHQVANHSFYHVNSKVAPASFLMTGIDRTDKLIAEAVGNKDSFYRPPYGKLTTWNLLRLWLSKRKIVLWNVDPKDYVRQSPEELLAWFEEYPIAGGDVVLLHDRLPYASAVIPHLATVAKEKGLRFATIDQLNN